MTPEQKRKEWAAALDLNENVVKSVQIKYDDNTEETTYYVHLGFKHLAEFLKPAEYFKINVKINTD